MSRQGEIADRPARAQPSTSCSSDHGFTVIELIESSARSLREVAHQAATPRVAITARMRAAARSGSREQAGRVGKAKQLGEMQASSARSPGRRPW